MAKMDHQKQNKFKHGAMDLRDERKSMGERWLEQNDPTVIKHPHLTKQEKAQRKRKARIKKLAKKCAKKFAKQQRGKQRAGQ